MDRVNGADWVDIGGGRRGFRSQNKMAGVAGTEVTATFLNSAQEELLAVIEASGQIPSASDNEQLLKALGRLTLASGVVPPFVPVISADIGAPPSEPANGAIYLVPEGATGAWNGHEQKIALWLAGNWSFVQTPDGHGVGLPGGQILQKVDGVYVEKIALDVQSGTWTYAPDTGTADALVATLAPAPSAYTAGMRVLIRKGAAANTGPDTTISLNGLGAKTVVDSRGGALVGGDLPGSALLDLDYDGEHFRVMRTVAADLGQQKSTFNITQLSFSARTVLSATGFTTYQSGTYVKKSATSDLVVEMLVTLADGGIGTAATIVRLTIGGHALQGVGQNNQSGQARAAGAAKGRYTGIAAGAVSWTLVLGRGDGTPWSSVVNPTATDQAFLPSETTSTIMISEIEP